MDSHVQMHVHWNVHLSRPNGGPVTSQTVILLSSAEAAARLHVSRRTVIRYGRAGLLDERRIGPKLVMVTEESVNAMLRGGQHDAVLPGRANSVRGRR